MRGKASDILIETYRDMWNDSPLAAVVSRDNRVAYVNPAARELLGADILGQPLERILAEHSPGVALGGAQPLRPAAGPPSQIKPATWRTSSGDVVLVLQQPRPEFLEALRHSAEMSSILASIADAVYVGDIHGIYICNRPALEMLGFDRPEELRDSVGNLADRIQTRIPETGEQLGVEEQPFVRALGGEQTIREVMVRHLKSNRDVVIRCAAAPVYFEGKIIAAVAVNTDITVTRKMERKLRETESLAAVGKLAWQVAHEINNPLQAATNLLSLAANDLVPEEDRKQYLAGAQAQLGRTAEVVRKVIGLHR